MALPSDSNFAIAMKHQQQAEKEEQQRIKNLVLNYDLGETEDPDGEDDHLLPLNPKILIHKSSSTGPEKPTTYHHNRADFKPGKNNNQRARRLQLSDVDWYGTSPSSNNPATASDAPDAPAASDSRRLTRRQAKGVSAGP